MMQRATGMIVQFFLDPSWHHDMALERSDRKALFQHRRYALLLRQILHNVNQVLNLNDLIYKNAAGIKYVRYYMD